MWGGGPNPGAVRGAILFGLRLDQLVDVLTHLESRDIGVHPQQCSRIRHKRSSCTLCADHCPAQAITWEEMLQVDPDQCTGCGICAAVCPTGALETQAPTNLELLVLIQELVKQGSTIAFACSRYLEARSVARDGTIHVKCLGQLDESILLAAISLGARTVWLIDGACQACPYAAGRTIAAQAVHRTTALLQAWNLAQHIFFGPDLPDGPSTAMRPSPRGDVLSRRTFFSLLARKTTGAAATVAAVAVDSILGSQDRENQRPQKGELPVHLPAKRRLLLAAVKRLEKPLVADFEADGGLWARFGFNQSCTGCQMCAFFCPTGALSKIERDGKAGVLFRTAYCTHCRLCQDICYKEAVILSPGVDLSQVLDEAVDVLWMPKVEATPWHTLGTRNKSMSAPQSVNSPTREDGPG